jgi:hypothetical protein
MEKEMGKVHNAKDSEINIYIYIYTHTYIGHLQYYLRSTTQNESHSTGKSVQCHTKWCCSTKQRGQEWRNIGKYVIRYFNDAETTAKTMQGRMRWEEAYSALEMRQSWYIWKYYPAVRMMEPGGGNLEPVPPEYVRQVTAWSALHGK